MNQNCLSGFNIEQLYNKWILKSILFLFLLAGSQNIYSQDQTPGEDSIINITDTAFASKLSRLRKLVREEVHKSAEIAKQNRNIHKQTEVLDNLRKVGERSKDYLDAGLDTLGIETDIDKIREEQTLAGDAIFTNKGTSQTYRNLAVSYTLLQELVDRVDVHLNRIVRYERDLSGFRNAIDSLEGDSSLFDIPADSAKLMQFFQRLVLVGKSLQPVDSSLKASFNKVKNLETSLTLLKGDLQSDMEEIDNYQKQIYQNAYKREFAPIWGPIGFRRPFEEIIRFSKAKGMIVMNYYIRINSGKLILLTLLIAGLTWYLGALKKYFEKHPELYPLTEGKLVIRNPFLSSVVLILNIFQFIFPGPPFMFLGLFWLVGALSLTWIFRQYISRWWMGAWLTLVTGFILSYLDNLVLQASRTERWLMLFISISGFVTGIIMLIGGRTKYKPREKAILIFIAIMVVLEITATILNILGLYNLSKTLLTAGSFNVVVGILFLWTVRLLNQILVLSGIKYRDPDKKRSIINFSKIGTSVPTPFYVLLVLGWLYLFGRNFYVFRIITEPISKFWTKERIVGEFNFTFLDIIVFFLIIFASGLLSKIVSYFATEMPKAEGKSTSQKGGLGSWILLIRIAIISMGLFFAFALAGIPIDRLTIILGALSVGIGFGMQALVNNLIGGLIVALEKPINVGDFIQIGGQSGTMKSIGFRSSVITTPDGADVVIPNGDLLTQHLVNWTMTNTRRRMEIKLGVAYGTDLKAAKEILKGLLEKEDRILKYPAPAVIIKEFGESSIDFSIYFWVGEFKLAHPTKSDLITEIDAAFQKNGITIPFPQQDLHIHYNELVKGLEAGKKTEDLKSTANNPEKKDDGNQPGDTQPLLVDE